ncbi:MAG: hypothetical protein WBF71_05375, partial [Microthrixaceae bacterium]
VDSQLMWGIANWCRARGASLPVGLATTLDTYLGYLCENKLLDPGSDQINLLRRAVAENGAELESAALTNDRRGSRSAAHPSRSPRPRLAPVLPIG